MCIMYINKSSVCESDFVTTQIIYMKSLKSKRYKFSLLEMFSIEYLEILEYIAANLHTYILGFFSIAIKILFSLLSIMSACFSV